MKTYLIRFSVNGIKNIEKTTSVDFLNNSLVKGKTINIQNQNVKGIFGINGAGKSAFVLAMDIYNTITLKNNYLVQDYIKNKLDKLINKKTKELFLENIFAISKDNDDNKIADVYKHTIIIKPSKNELGQKIYSLNENLSELVGNSINSEYKEIYNVSNGKLAIKLDSLLDKEQYINEYSNRLGESTLSSYFLNYVVKYEKEIVLNKKNLSFYLYNLYLNASTTRVFMDNDDIHENIRIDNISIDKTNESLEFIKDYSKYIITFKLNEDVVNEFDLDMYNKKTDKLKEFIQILKPNLRDIKVDKKYDGEKYHLKKVFFYDDYEVDEEFESTGIKRIIKMYSYIDSMVNGYKVFIDELDANISGVFLDKLIEFLEENAKGQLCFTSHNILSMNILRKYKNSITSFGETGKVVDIVKNGHYSPVNLFYEGFVEDSPFNINSFDFFKSFDLEE